MHTREKLFKFLVVVADTNYTNLQLLKDNGLLVNFGEDSLAHKKIITLYSSRNGFRIKSEIKLSEYNCNQDLVSSKTENQIGFSISQTWNIHLTWKI